ncbi:MAG: diguanylate cyclase/phosphodiesterase with PAS/PAC and GAF sensor(s) [Methylococcaceae bacterium NSP1-2]|nr:EAL domain-containing protein [Methylococcaceae bacterium]OYV20710.1 MAG: diguanylate cyclase/phosphodiesterase with PAS/PAC and GAF sensor(s) [Methylococcaceae bacterium NSP1-2]
MTSTPAFSSRLSDSYLPTVIASTGIALTLTLSWLAWLLTKGRVTAETCYRQLFEQSVDGVLMLNREHRLIDANTAALQLLGYTREELLKLRLPDILAKHERPRMDAAVNKMMAGTPHLEEWVHVRKDGTEFPAEVSTSRLDEWNYFGIFRDLTEQKKAEQRIQRLTRLYQALSETNQAIVRMSNEVDLFPMVCRCTVDYGDMKMAWIGQLDESSSNIMKASAYGSGLEYLDELIISTNNNMPEGQGPTATALRENRTIIIKNYLTSPLTRPWHALAKQFSWHSAGAFPIQRNGKPFAVLNVYSDKVCAFDEEAIHLLNEMAIDISFALDNFDREAQRQHSIQELTESEAKLSLILENVGAYIYLKDSEGRYLFANRQVLDLWGVTLEQVVGFGDEKFFDTQTVEKIQKNDRFVLVEGKVLQQEETNTAQKTGKTATYWSVKLPLRRVNGDIYGLCGISTDITEHKAAEERIRVLSNFDSLTQLPNRNLLFDRAQQALTAAKRTNDNVILMYLDLDRFKIINDSLGPSAGNQILKELSVRLNKHLYREDTLCRPGGDEFILLLPNTDVEGAAHVAKKIFEICTQPFCIAGQRVSLTVSIGIAEFPQDGDNFEQLSQSADAALSRAKQNGRNNFQFFTRQLQEQASRILRIENELYDAVEKGEFLLHYQPQVDANTSKIIGAEVLIRWQHPQKGMVSPSEFIPIAEECGLMIDIGDWVLQTAIRQIAAWQTAGLAIVPVAVNLSIVQFRQDTLYDKIAEALQQNGLDPAMLELEITEGIAMENFERTIDVLNRLHQLGITLSIDDFGTGYSSLSYLKRFKINKLKIDRSFVQDLSSNPEDEAIVTAIINMAKSLGFKTIAEGVETLEQLNFLREKKCDEIQGYYFSKPVPAEAFANLLRNGGSF